jgi:hypothetical protein
MDCGLARAANRLGLLLVLIVLGESAWAEVVRSPTVLFLFALRSTAPAVHETEVAFRDSLEKGFGAPVDVHVEYLDLPDASVVPYGRLLVDLLHEK